MCEHTSGEMIATVRRFWRATLYAVCMGHVFFCTVASALSGTMIRLSNQSKLFASGDCLFTVALLFHISCCADIDQCHPFLQLPSKLLLLTQGHMSVVMDQ